MAVSSTTAATPADDLTLAKLAKAIYEPEPECRRQAAELGYNLLGPLISQADADCGLFRGKSGSPAVLAFRGTQASGWHWRDIGANFGLLRPWAGPGLVHAGYRDQHARIRDRARAGWEAIPGAIPLIVTGHSLGGSLAHLFAAWACGPGQGRVAKLVTFGAPRAGTAAAWEPLRDKGVDVRVYQTTGDFAYSWPYYAPFRLCQPAEPIRLKSPKWYYGPLKRHWIETYIDAILDAHKQQEK